MDSNGEKTKLGKAICGIKGIFRILVYFGENGRMPKPGEAPICEQIKAENLRAHKEIREYIKDVDTRAGKVEVRAGKAIDDLKKDMNKQFDRLFSAVLSKNQ
jgi:hypothetical protein